MITCLYRVKLMNIYKLVIFPSFFFFNCYQKKKFYTPFDSGTYFRIVVSFLIVTKISFINNKEEKKRSFFCDAHFWREVFGRSIWDMQVAFHYHSLSWVRIDNILFAVLIRNEFTSDLIFFALILNFLILHLTFRTCAFDEKKKKL